MRLPFASGPAVYYLAETDMPDGICDSYDRYNTVETAEILDSFPPLSSSQWQHWLRLLASLLNELPNFHLTCTRLHHQQRNLDRIISLHKATHHLLHKYRSAFKKYLRPVLRPPLLLVRHLLPAMEYILPDAISGRG